MNFTGDHHLNLIGKVAIVTSCSSTQGVAICRTLLNSNAFVLGVDREVHHDSTRFTKASHFQFLKVGDEGYLCGDIGERILGAVGHHYHKDAVDFLVNVIGKGQDFVEELKRMEGVLDNMVKRGTGLVLNVSDREGADGEESLVKVAKDASLGFKKSGIRWNVLVSHNLLSNSNHRFILGADTKSALQNHMDEHKSKQQKGGYAVEKEREMANLALFFCSRLGSELNGAFMGIDGTCVSL